MPDHDDDIRYLSIVRGFDKYVRVPHALTKDIAWYRTAIVMHPLSGEESLDVSLFADLLDLLTRVIEHDEVQAVFDDQTVNSISEAVDLMHQDEEIGPPSDVFLRHRGETVAAVNTELWALLGGPPPYHDSYTVSLYSQIDCFDELSWLLYELCLARQIVLKQILIRKQLFQPSKRPWWCWWRA